MIKQVRESCPEMVRGIAYGYSSCRRVFRSSASLELPELPIKVPRLRIVVHKYAVTGSTKGKEHIPAS